MPIFLTAQPSGLILIFSKTIWQFAVNSLSACSFTAIVVRTPTYSTINRFQTVTALLCLMNQLLRIWTDSTVIALIFKSPCFLIPDSQSKLRLPCFLTPDCFQLKYISLRCLRVSVWVHQFVSIFLQFQLIFMKARFWCSSMLAMITFCLLQAALWSSIMIT